jgi:hypothetical protein
VARIYQHDETAGIQLQSHMNFCFDVVDYPNLARPGLADHEFDQHWPCTVPFRIGSYLKSAGINYNCYTVDSAPTGSWYPINLRWHDFDCDYIGLVPDTVKQRLRQHEIRLLFHYHEGDNPERIKRRFDSLCVQHNLPVNCYRFVSANSAAKLLDGFYYFSDHELFFKYVNRYQTAPEITAAPRDHTFTALSRAHKWWRATCMSQLHQDSVLTNSLWSYNNQVLIGDQPEDNPISMTADEQAVLTNFLNSAPYYCDSDDSAAHNNHRHIPEHLYTHSYCNLVLETFFDADQSNGAFVTEKTYKCIKFGQPFVIIGTPNSLQCLRDDGYRTFDHVIDNSYDSITDNQQRWQAVKRTIADIKQQDLYQWYVKCLPDLQHNQQVYLQQQTPALTKLVTWLTTNWNTV